MLNQPLAMYHRFIRTPTQQEHDELQRMTQQEVGRVAERARMILLSGRGFTVQEIINVFEVVDETLYKWFDRFDEEGPEGLYDRDRSGRPPEIDEEAQRELERLLERSPVDEGYSFTTWTRPLLRSPLSEHMGIDVSDDTVRRTLHRLAFVWRRPRWKIDYEDPRYEERMQAIDAALVEAQTSSMTVLFEDETDCRRLPPLRQMWMRRGEQACVKVPASNDKFSLYGVVDPLSGETFTAPYPKGKSQYTEAFLEAVLSRFEGQVLLVWDQASWHTSEMIENVVAGYERLEVLLLPKRAPQENPMEDLWRHLKRLVAANLERDLAVLKEACRAFFERLSNRDALRMAGLAA
jgi:transposase